MTSSSFARPAQNGPANGAFRQQPNGQNRQQHTLTALGRWSIANRPLPPVEQIKHLHVYDFDNTRVFPSSLPRLEVWLSCPYL